MSKLDLISLEDREIARTAGWDLVVVVDARTQKSSAQVMPLRFDTATPSVRVALQRVIRYAQAGDQTAMRALRAMAGFNSKGTP